MFYNLGFIINIICEKNNCSIVLIHITFIIYIIVGKPVHAHVSIYSEKKKKISDSLGLTNPFEVFSFPRLL